MRKLRRIPRWLRFALDAFLTMILLLAVYMALGRPFRGETAAFRQAEKTNLVGPSVIIDRLTARPDWLNVTWDRLLIGDDGEEVLFWFSRRSPDTEVLYRYEKSGGMLLLPLPRCNVLTGMQLQRDMAAPLFLFVDEPGAVKATVRISLSETDEITLSQVRGELAHTQAGDADSRERYFLFSIPVTRENWKLNWGAQVRELLLGYAYIHPYSPAGFPVTIWLYDEEDRLIETREWTL